MCPGQVQHPGNFAIQPGGIRRFILHIIGNRVPHIEEAHIPGIQVHLYRKKPEQLWSIRIFNPPRNRVGIQIPVSRQLPAVLSEFNDVYPPVPD